MVRSNLYAASSHTAAPRLTIRSIAKYELPTAARPESAPYRYAIANMARSYFGARRPDLQKSAN